MAEDEIVDYQEDEPGNDLYGGQNGLEVNNVEGGEEEVESDEMKKKVLEMEQELDQLTKMQQQVERQINTTSDRLDENSMFEFPHNLLMSI
jgi:hypothetical protein